MVEEARTEFVARMDGDDIFSPERFAKQMAAMADGREAPEDVSSEIGNREAAVPPATVVRRNDGGAARPEDRGAMFGAGG